MKTLIEKMAVATIFATIISVGLLPDNAQAEVCEDAIAAGCLMEADPEGCAEDICKAKPAKAAEPAKPVAVAEPVKQTVKQPSKPPVVRESKPVKPALVCTAPQVAQGDVCGCEDPNSSGASCACNDGFVSMTSYRGDACVAFDPALAYASDISAAINAIPPTDSGPGWLVWLLLALLVLLGGVLGVYIYYSGSELKDLRSKLNELLAAGDLKALAELRKELKELEGNYDNVVANSKSKAEAVEKTEAEITKVRGEITKLREPAKSDDKVKEAMERARANKESLEDELEDLKAEADAATKAKADLHGQIMALRERVKALEQKLVNLGVAIPEDKKKAQPAADSTDAGSPPASA